MRHRKAGLKLNRTSSHRNAMFRNMVTSLFKHDRIRTTNAKAKELRSWADHLITLAKRGDLHARRQALSIVREKDVVHKLFDEASKRFGTVSGGYTRIVKLGRRPGDAAPVSIIELIASETSKKKKGKKKDKADIGKKQPGEEKAGEEKAVSDDKKVRHDGEITKEATEATIETGKEPDNIPDKPDNISDKMETSPAESEKTDEAVMLDSGETNYEESATDKPKDKQDIAEPEK